MCKTKISYFNNTPSLCSNILGKIMGLKLEGSPEDVANVEAETGI